MSSHPNLQLLPLGVGDAFTARHYTTCFALGAGDDWLLIDCSHPIRKLLREGSEAAKLEKPLDLDRIAGVVLTHLHADHCSGFEDYLFYMRFALNRRGHLLAHPRVAERLDSGVMGGAFREVTVNAGEPPRDLHVIDFVDHTPLSLEAPVTFGPFTIACRRTAHPIFTTALRIEAFGRVFAFSADSAYDPALINWLAPADLIVHEVTTQGESPVHTPYRHLAALPEPLRRKMRLSHYPDDFNHDASAVATLRQGRIETV